MSSPDAAVAQALDRLRLYGTDQVPPEPLVLRVGALAARFDEGTVRSLSWQGVEILRGVAYLLRDENWATATCAVEDLEVAQDESRFELHCALRMTQGAHVLMGRAHIVGTREGEFSYRASTTADAALRTNRCGFVVLHPAACAGLPLVVTHTDGRDQHTTFPREISPAQPIFDIRALQWQPAPGITALCRLEAELPHDPLGKFEMEDQRNWSDASYKTYVGSLLDPWPYVLPAGRTMTQSVHLRVLAQSVHPRVHAQSVHPRVRSDGPASSRATVPSVPALHLGEAGSMAMPPLGIGVAASAQHMQAAERDAVIALAPAWLVAEAPLDATDLREHLHAVAELARAAGAQVQLDVLVPAGLDPEQAAAAAAAQCDAAAFVPQALRACPVPYLTSFQPGGPWPDLPPLEHYAQALGRAFPGARIGGGMATYFTELNRKRPTEAQIGFIGHATCPIVHTADDASVMETIESLPHIARSVRALWPNLGYRLGPAMLAMRRNPYGAAPAPNPQRLRIAMADVDPRHQGRFGAAWTAAYATAVAPFGLELLALHQSHGPSGPLLDEAQPDWTPGACVPAWSVLGVLRRAQGRALVDVSGLPASVVALAWAAADGRHRMLLAHTGAGTVDLPFAQALLPLCLATDEASGPAATRAQLGPFDVQLFRTLP